MNKETPTSKWATWALLQAAFQPDALVKDSIGELCAHRLQKLVGEYPSDTVQPGKRSFVAMTNTGYWARGNTPEAACKGLLKQGARKTDKVNLALVLNDDTPEVNQMGAIISESDSAQLNIGRIGTVGSIINAAAK